MMNTKSQLSRGYSGKFALEISIQGYLGGGAGGSELVWGVGHGEKVLYP